jgi:phenylpropionate dioxygenase-like ring-hydroxylating dioxygenase large terminal subunit
MSGATNSRAPSGEEIGVALRRCWQPVARVQDLEDGPQRAVLLGEPLAVFLTGGGAPRVVSDRCPHRGASLAMGAVCGEGIQCPYHGWEWSGEDGRCLRIPSLADQRQIPPGARVASYPARVQWGLVWTALEEPIGELPAVPWFDPGEWRWGHGEPFELPVALGLMIENFRDVAHFAFVHRATLGAMPEVIEPLDVNRRGIEVTMHREMRGGEGGEEVWGSLREIYYHTVAPNLTSARMVTVDAERCLLHAARAISATESVHYWLVGLSEDFEEQTLEEAIEAEARVYAEDRRVVSAVEPPELPLDPNADLNTLADRFTLAYREGFSEYVRRVLSLR